MIVNNSAYNEVQEPLPVEQEPAARDVDVMDLLLVLSRGKFAIAKITGCGLIVALALAFLLPVKYESTARILPPGANQGGGAAALLNALPGGAALGSSASALLGGSLNLKNPGDVYVAMLKSRTVADKLINRFDLRKIYREKTYTDTRKKLAKYSQITAGKEGVITVQVEDKSPERARDIAQAYVDELLALSETVAVSEAAQRRLFFERQLIHEKDALAQAELDLKKVQEKTGLISPSDQARVILESVGRVRAMITAKEVQLGAMRAFAAEGNPAVLQAERELAELRAQQAKLEKATPTNEGTSFLPTGKVPENALEFFRQYRELRYHETLFELLARQFELAKIDEARDYAGIQVLDQAFVPDKRSKPPRLLIIFGLTLASFFGGCLWVLLVNRAQYFSEPSNIEKWRLVKSEWQQG